MSASILATLAPYADTVELTPLAEAKQTVLAAVLGWQAETTIDVDPGQPALYIGAATKVDARLALPSLAKARGLGRVGIYDVDPSTGEPGRVIKHWTKAEGMIVVSPGTANGAKPAHNAPGMVKAAPAAPRQPKPKADPQPKAEASPAPAAPVKAVKAKPITPAPAASLAEDVKAETAKASPAAILAEASQPKASPVKVDPAPASPWAPGYMLDTSEAAGILGWLAGIMARLTLWFASQTSAYVRASQASQAVKAARVKAEAAKRQAKAEAEAAKAEARRQAKAEARRAANPELAMMADSLATLTAILANGQAVKAAPVKAVSPAAPVTVEATPAAPVSQPKAKAVKAAPVTVESQPEPTPAPAASPAPATVDVDPAPAILASQTCQRPGCDSGQSAVPASPGGAALYCLPCIDHARAIAAKAVAAKASPAPAASPAPKAAPVAPPKASPAKTPARTEAEWTAAVASPCTVCGEYSLEGPVCRECQTMHAVDASGQRPAPKGSPAAPPKAAPKTEPGTLAGWNGAINGQAKATSAGMPSTADIEARAELAAVEAMCQYLDGMPDVRDPAIRATGFARGQVAYARVAKREPTNMALSIMWDRAKGAVMDARAVARAAATVKAAPVPVQSQESASGDVPPTHPKASKPKAARVDTRQASLLDELADAAKAEARALAAEVDPASPAVQAASATMVDAYLEAYRADLSPAECREMAGFPAACDHGPDVPCIACKTEANAASGDAAPAKAKAAPKAKAGQAVKAKPKASRADVADVSSLMTVGQPVQRGPAK